MGSAREVKILTSPLTGLTFSDSTSGASARLSTFPSAFPLMIPPEVRDAPWREPPCTIPLQELLRN